MKLSSTIDKTLEHKLFNSLVSYFKNENYKLGLGVTDAQIDATCKILLYGEEDIANAFLSWQVAEQSALDKYRKEELEIVDYLHLISNELRKQLGQYATPANIVRYIFKSVGYVPSNDILPKKVIDPACGSGAFLVEAVRIYLNALKKAKTPIHKWYPMVISAICGIDIDATACFFARLNLSMLLSPAVLEFVSNNDITKLKPLPVYCADTLQLFVSGDEGAGLFYDRRNQSLKRRFDFVVGNPPYFKIKNLKDDLKTAYEESIYGHPNAYGLFIHAGIGMLKNNGRLGFIVPRSMLSGLYFKNLRSFIENNASLREIVYLSDRKNIFDNVLHGTMILSLERAAEAGKKVSISFVQSSKEIRNNQPHIKISPDNVVRRLNGSTVWFVADSEKTYGIIGRIIKKHPILSGDKVNCRAKTGQIVWNRVKLLLSVRSEADMLPLVWATDVSKFGFSFNRMGTERPCNLKVTPRTENLIVKGMSILLQRVTADEQPSRIVACIPDEFCLKAADGYFVENHLNIVQPEKGDPMVDLYFLLGVLNSEVVEFFFRAMNGNTQVSATELNLLPIPVGRYEHEIATTARRIQNTANYNRKAGLMEDLNMEITRAYGLDNDDHAFVRKFLSDRRKNDN
ncbi:MAG: N-6 DNA methylase [Nitrospirota bacterium]